jgi:hypothetical protein
VVCLVWRLCILDQVFLNAFAAILPILPCYFGLTTKDNGCFYGGDWIRRSGVVPCTFYFILERLAFTTINLLSDGILTIRDTSQTLSLVISTSRFCRALDTKQRQDLCVLIVCSFRSTDKILTGMKKHALGLYCMKIALK